MCRGRRDSRDSRNIQSPPVVIGEEQIDNMSNLWKDEDKTTLYEYANGRSEPHKIAYYMTILACKLCDNNSHIFSIFNAYQLLIYLLVINSYALHAQADQKSIRMLSLDRL